MPGSTIRKIIFVGSILLYAGISLIGGTRNAYLEYGGPGRMISHHFFLILLVAILTGLPVAYFFPRVFPRAYAIQRKAGRIALICIFFVMAFGVAISFFLLLNSSVGKQRTFHIEGVLVEKWKKVGAKGSRSYFARVNDLATGKEYTFRIKAKVYRQLGLNGGFFSKDFVEGSFGVIYRRNE